MFMRDTQKKLILMDCKIMLYKLDEVASLINSTAPNYNENKIVELLE